MLKIKDLSVAIENKEVLSHLNLVVPEGEVHLLMGPNGMGKSSLARFIAGDPHYEVLSGEVSYREKNLLSLTPEERVHRGLFVSFQYPPEIPGVTTAQFLFHSFNAKRKATGEKEISEKEFIPLLDEKLSLLQLRLEFKQRALNCGFSGGEKKKIEILQMALLEPTFSLLDETDSGLDMDSMKQVIQAILKIKKEKSSLLIITHSLRLFEYLNPNQIHILLGGKIVASGAHELVEILEKRGYQPFSQC